MELIFMKKILNRFLIGILFLCSINLIYGSTPNFETTLFTSIEIMNAPADTTVACDQYNPEPIDPQFTDDCPGDLSISFSETTTRGNDVDNCSFFEYEVKRKYTVTNNCNDTLTFVHTITVVDTTGPQFTVPPAVTVNCVDVNNLMITGTVLADFDICGGPTFANYFDEEIISSCNTTFSRTWVVSDVCGNNTAKIQMITVFDTIPPKFVSAPRDVSVSCFLTDNPYAMYNEWIANFGYATYSDCDIVNQRFVAVPGSYDINDSESFPGIHPGALNDPSCGSKKSVIQFEEVDFVIIDACGNAAAKKATFNFIDAVPPKIQECTSNSTFVLGRNSCDTTIIFPIPTAFDECVIQDINVVISNEQVLFSSQPGSTEVPVNNLHFKLGSYGPEITFSDSNYFNVQMTNIDGDQISEYFTIIDEDGFEWGNTPNIGVQCGDTSFVIGPFSNQQLKKWTIDKYVDFTFINNIDSTDNSLSINDICIGSRITISQTYTIKRTIDPVKIFLKIDQDDPILVSGISAGSSFRAGEHIVRFIAEDCAGNQSFCEKKLSIKDKDIPLVSCAPSMILSTLPDSCSSPKLLKDMMSVQDECGETNLIKIKITGATINSFEGTIDEIENNNIFFSSGFSNMTVTAIDFSNNSSQCSIQVTVNDIQKPTAICTQKIVKVIAVALESINVTPKEIGGNSIDNCGIDNILISNNFYNCSDLNTTVSRNVIVIDKSGNSSSCVGNFYFEEDRVPLSYQAGLCPNDPLTFYTNIEDKPYYSYIWDGPLGFFSGEASPVIPNVSPIHEGLYGVTITNTNTGCESYASIDVNIADVKTPVLTTDTIGCEAIPHRLESTEIFGAVSYNWYEFFDGMYHPLTYSDESVVEILLPPGDHNILVTASNENCESAISNFIKVDVRVQPNGANCETLIKGCIGDPLILCVKDPQPEWNIKWTGPQGFISNLPNPVVTESFSSANSGIYKLIIENNQCITDTLTTAVTSNVKPNKPSIIGTQKYCEGDTLVLASSLITNQNVYVWNSPTGIIRTNNPVLKIANATNAYTGSWKLSIERGPCVSEYSESVDIIVEPNLFFGITNVPTQCIGAQIQLKTSIIPESMYKWTGPNGFTSIAANPFITAMPGIYKVEIESPNGCLYGDQIDLKTVNKPVILEITKNENSECLPVGSTIVLNSRLNANENITYNWKGPNGLTSISKVLAITNFAKSNNGDYSLTVSNGACESDPLTSNLSYIISPVRPIIDGSSVACIGDSLTLISSAYDIGTKYFWNTPIGIIETDTNNLVIKDVTKSLEGDYTLMVTKGTCSSPVSEPMSIIINENILVPDVFLIGDQCIESNIILFTNFEGEFPIEWELPNGNRVFADSIRLMDTKLSDVGIYRARSYFNSCPSFWSQNITVDFSDPRIGVSIPDNSLFSCNNDDAFLEFCVEDQNGGNNKIYQWFLGEKMIGETTDMCFPVVDFSIFSSGVNKINLKLSQNGCTLPFDGSIFLEIENVRGLGLKAGEDQLFCRDQELYMDADAPISNKLKGFWSFKDNFEISNFNDPAATVVIEDDLAKTELIWTVEHEVCGIVIRDTVVLTQKTKPEGVSDTFFFDDKELIFDPLENDILLPNNSYTLTETSEPRWGEVRLRGDAISFKTDPKYVGGPITFQYTVCDTECPTLCDDGDVIIYYNLGSCKGNNVITANNDGINDIFIIPCIDEENLPTNELTIINELGNTVFQQSPYDNTWDGTFNGQILPEGTYYYIFRRNEKSSIVQGFITIER